MESGFQITRFPKHIIEEIFSFVKDLLSLRLVSKYFKYIIDSSPRLMLKYSLNVTKSDINDLHDINPYFSEVQFNDLGPKEFAFVTNYQHKDNIKSTFIKSCDNPEIKRSLLMFQHILFNFKNLEQMYIWIDDDSDTSDYEDIPIDSEKLEKAKLINPHHTKLTRLSVDIFPSINYLLYAFSSISSIKVLNFQCESVGIFPDVTWRLEELRLHAYLGIQNVQSVKNFLEKQKSTLKVLKCLDFIEANNLIVKKLYNLESVLLRVSDITIFDDNLITNDVTKNLAVAVDDGDKVTDALELLLKYYKNVETLNIAQSKEGSVDFKDFEFPNVKCLLITENPIELIMNAKFPKLKILDLVTYNVSLVSSKLNMIPHENLVGVERMTIFCSNYLDEFKPVLQKCHSLYHLNFGFYPNAVDVVIKKIMDLVPQIRCFGILQGNLTRLRTSCAEILSKVNNPKLVIKVYKDFPSMIHGYWRFGDHESHRYERLAGYSYAWWEV